MEQYSDLQDWEILQGPDPIPDVAAVATSGVDYDYFVVGSGERDHGRGGGESGFEVERGGLGEKGEGDFQADRDGLEVLPADGSGIEVGVHGVEHPMEDLLGLSGIGVVGVEKVVGVEEENSGVIGLGEGNKEKAGDPMEISFREQSEISRDGVEYSLETSADGGYFEKVEEADEGSDLGVIVEEIKDDTDIIGTIEEIEANTDSSEWAFAHSSNDVPKPELTEESNEEISEQGIVSGGNGDKSEVVWWKFPLEFVKFCAFNVKPVWTISMVAAMVGFALIGRRWYNMKRRRRGVTVKLGINDKKASQAVVRASRLNEAFSLVKRVPLLKTSIPNDGMTPWPAMALI